MLKRKLTTTATLTRSCNCAEVAVVDAFVNILLSRLTGLQCASVLEEWELVREQRGWQSGAKKEGCVK